MSDNKSYQSDVTLTSMKRAVKRAKSDKVMSSAPDPYPYGLSIDLDEDGLKKLGLNINDFSVGDTVELHASATVRALRQSEENSGSSETMSLQITDLCVEPDDTDSEDDEE
jgi:hypothetical protein